MIEEEKLVVYGTRWCGDCRRALKMLNERNLTFIWVDIDRDPKAEAYVIVTNHGNRSVPTIVFPDGSIMVEPSNNDLSLKLDSMA